MKYISGEVIVTEVIDNYNPTTRDWLGLVPTILGNGLAQIGHCLSAEVTNEELLITNYQASLPCELECLTGVTDNCGNSLSNLTSIGRGRGNFSTIGYKLKPGNIIETTFKEGKIYLNYSGILCDDQGYPYIPDNVFVKRALRMLVLQTLITRGFKHPSFDFETTEILWDKYRGEAHADLVMPSKADMERFRKYVGAYVKNPTTLTTQFNRINENFRFKN